MKKLENGREQKTDLKWRLFYLGQKTFCIPDEDHPGQGTNDSKHWQVL